MKTKDQKHLVFELLPDCDLNVLQAREVAQINEQHLVLQYGHGGRMPASEIGKSSRRGGI